MDDNKRLELYRSEQFRRKRVGRKKRYPEPEEHGQEFNAPHNNHQTTQPQHTTAKHPAQPQTTFSNRRATRNTSSIVQNQLPSYKSDFKQETRGLPAPQPTPSFGNFNDGADGEVETIFVSIPSYRDSECSNTLLDLFRKARIPTRIRVGVYEQNAPGDKSCMAFNNSNRYRDQIRVKTVSHYEARGPMVARAVVEQELYQPSDYILNIDSHTIFTKNWDVLIIAQLKECPSKKAVLTMYPKEYTQNRRNVGFKEKPSYLVFTGFHPRLLFPQQKRMTCLKLPKTPLPSILWAGGFSFARTQILEEVPYDINCNFVFLGEEISMAVRLFTHGWDTYSPKTMLVHHLWDRNYRPLFWEQIYRKNSVVTAQTRAKHKAMETEAVERIQKLIWLGECSEPEYGLGTERTLEEFKEMSGLDLINAEFLPRAGRGLSADPTEEELSCKMENTFNRRVGSFQRRALKQKQQISQGGGSARGQKLPKMRPARRTRQYGNLRSDL